MILYLAYYISYRTMYTRNAWEMRSSSGGTGCCVSLKCSMSSCAMRGRQSAYSKKQIACP